MPARVSVRIDGSRTVVGCIRRRSRRDGVRRCAGDFRYSRRVDPLNAVRSVPRVNLGPVRIPTESQEGEFCSEVFVLQRDWEFATDRAWVSDGGFHTARPWAFTSIPQIVFGQELTVNRRATPNVTNCVRQSG